MPCTLRIGLTGGIGSGKSAAARAFARLGATIIDTDIIARELVEPGQPALQELIDLFGPDIVDKSGGLERDRLRQLVFNDAEKRKRLEAILHPKIHDRALALAKRADAGYCILVIPLLAESGNDYQLDRVLLIDCPESLQRQRIQDRDRLSNNDIDAMLAAQASRRQRLNIADDIIVNDQDFEHLAAEVKRLHREYSHLAAAHY